MRRVVHFTNTFAPMVGGIERSVAQAAAFLARHGHLCRIVTPAFTGAERSREGVLRLPAIKGIGEKGFSLRLPLPGRVESWMEAIEPEVLHAHQPFMLGDTAWRVARARHVPLVFTHHTLYERYADQLPLNEETARRLLLSLTTHFANRCDVCLAPTGSVAALMRERGIEAPIEVVPTGITVEIYATGDAVRARQAHSLPDRGPVIGHLGRLVEAKNLRYLVQAASELLTRREDAVFLLVGEGDELESALRHFEEAGVRDRAISAGTLTGPAVADAYAAMDLFLFASHTDTQGLVLAEAMAAGAVVLALDAPGARDCVADGRSGILLPSKAPPTAMAQAAEALLADPGRLEALSRGAREHALEFDEERCGTRLLAVYEEAIEAGARQPAPATLSSWEHWLQRVEDEWDLLADKLEITREAIS
jgi:1,2-diacylglycerol 3-alpha-glucosyltransferase